MPFDAAKALEATHLTSPKTLVVVGGTTGVGAAVARQFAQLGCSRIILVGRNAQRANEVLQSCSDLAPGSNKIDTQFVQADISTRAAMRACAASVKKAAGDAKVDYLIMTQNGVPVKTYAENEDGDGAAFAVQAISRFIISELLAEGGALAHGATVVSVCNPGNSLDSLQVEDLSLKQASKGYWTTTGFFMSQSLRDSSVIDAFMMEQNKRFPQFKFFHVHPGLVGDGTFTHNAFPFPLNWVTWLAEKTGYMIGTAQFANIPVYVALNPDDTEKRVGGRFLNHKFKSAPPGKWAQDKGHRSALWRKLEDMAKPRA